MQLLTFSVAGEPYAIESRRVVEVLPRVPARPLPLAPDYLPGVFTYRGSLVPLVDLARRLGVAPSPERLSTRVIVVDAAGGGGTVRLGLVAENVVAVRSADGAEASLPALALPGAAFLDRILRLGRDTVQLIDVDRLLPDELVAGLLPAAAAVPPAEARP
ncbi:MAG: chemotaxis protein CheW [Planctomycetota bacterium]